MQRRMLNARIREDVHQAMRGLVDGVHFRSVSQAVEVALVEWLRGRGVEIDQPPVSDARPKRARRART